MLEDAFGPAPTHTTADALVVSPETRTGERPSIESAVNQDLRPGAHRSSPSTKRRGNHSFLDRHSKREHGRHR